MKSKKYGDYAIKDGQLIGEFEEMYQNAEEIPWHQDKTAFALFTDIDLSIIKHYNQQQKFKNICEIACGYGYITNRLKTEIFTEEDCQVRGFDISQTAIEKATTLFDNIDFEVVDILKDDLNKFKNKFDFLYIKALFWFIIEDIDLFKDNIEKILEENGYIYITNSIPDLENFYGKESFPDALSIINYFKKHFDVVHASSTYEFAEKIVGNHYSKNKHVRIMLKKLNTKK